MLNVNPQQFALLEASAERRHAQYLSQLLATTYPAAMAGNESADTDYVLRAMAEAAVCGIRPLGDMDDFVEATVLMGEGFVHRQDLPWASTVVRDARAQKGRRLLELARIVRATAADKAD